MGNIIDLKNRLPVADGETKDNSHDNNVSDKMVVDISEQRSAAIQEDRRQAKRTILTEFIAVHTVIQGYGLLKVVLFDINEWGLSFELEYRYGRFSPGDQIELRIYLNHKTYFKLEVKISHVVDLKEEYSHRHGCAFINESVNNVALHHFVKFLENVTASLHRDKGDIMVSKINS